MGKGGGKVKGWGVLGGFGGFRGLRVWGLRAIPFVEALGFKAFRHVRGAWGFLGFGVFWGFYCLGTFRALGFGDFVACSLRALRGIYIGL